MKRLMILAMVLVIAGGALAEDTFGLWRVTDGDYVNYLYRGNVTTPFTLYITVHDPSSFSVGGYEVGIDIPEFLLILSATGPNGWTNFGDATNQLVGFQTPVIIQTELGVLGELGCVGLEIPPGPATIQFHGADPPSIPGHDGPVYANGVNPDELIPCGFVTGSPDVFEITDPLATRTDTWSGVKDLFD